MTFEKKGREGKPKKLLRCRCSDHDEGHEDIYLDVAKTLGDIMNTIRGISIL